MIIALYKIISVMEQMKVKNSYQGGGIILINQ